jgi:hypothetical protein
MKIIIFYTDINISFVIIHIIHIIYYSFIARVLAFKLAIPQLCPNHDTNSK